MFRKKTMHTYILCMMEKASLNSRSQHWPQVRQADHRRQRVHLQRRGEEDRAPALLRVRVRRAVP
jgi:hypothetical protein